MAAPVHPVLSTNLTTRPNALVVAVQSPRRRGQFLGASVVPATEHGNRPPLKGQVWMGPARRYQGAMVTSSRLLFNPANLHRSPVYLPVRRAHRVLQPVLVRPVLPVQAFAGRVVTVVVASRRPLPRRGWFYAPRVLPFVAAVPTTPAITIQWTTAGDGVVWVTGGG